MVDTIQNGKKFGLMMRPITKKEMSKDIFNIIKDNNPEIIQDCKLNEELFIYNAEVATRDFIKIIHRTMIDMDKRLKN